VGTARSAETREIARKIGLCDRIVDTSAEAVEGADLVVLCVPVGAMGSVAREIAPHLAPGATVTDVGSVKRDVIAEVAPHLPEGVHFVPAHPLAGTEHSGPTSGFAELFDNRYTLLTPAEGTDPGGGGPAPAALGRLRRECRGDGRRSP
jgi:cyclohexadieny/prephenate dehydrogenase